MCRQIPCPHKTVEHRKLRAKLLQRYTVGDLCVECHQPMYDPTAIDLCHDHTNGGYLGLGHASCNRREGAARGNRARGTTRHARHW